MRPLIRVFFVMLLMLAIFSTTALAGVFDLVPPRPAELGTYSATPNYEKFDLTAYVFDYKDSFTDRQDKLVIVATNTLLLVKAWLVKLSIRAMEYAVSGDLMEPLTQTAIGVMGSLGQWLWEIDGAPLVVAALAFTALCSLIAVLSRRLSRSLQIMAGTALVLLASYALLAVVPDVLPGLRGLASSASQQSIEVVGVAAQAEGSEELLIKSGNAAWDTFVYEPWLDGEFNDRTAAAEYISFGLNGGGILEMKIDERPKIYSDRLPAVGGAIHPHFQPWRPEFIEWRMLLALFTLVAGGVFAVSLLLLSGGIIFYQLVLLVAVALLPLWLLAALWWPQGSVRLLLRILTVALGALLRQVLLAVMLAVALVLMLAIKTALPSSGWVLQSLLMAVITLAAFRYRLAWFAGLTAPFVVAEKDAREMKKEERGENAVFIPIVSTEVKDTDNEIRENIGSPALQLPRWSDDGRETTLNPTRPAWSAAPGPAEFRREMMSLRQR